MQVKFPSNIEGTSQSSTASSSEQSGRVAKPTTWQRLASAICVPVRTSTAASSSTPAPRVKLTPMEQVKRVFTEGKFTNNKMRVIKHEKANLEAKLESSKHDLERSQHYLKSTAFVDYRTLEDFSVKSLGSHNNREEIRRNQRDALMHEIISQTKTPLPQGFRPGMFMYAPADVMVVLNDKGEVNLALAELNSQNYDGSTAVPPDMHANFMAHYYRVGADWAKEHREKSPDEPMLIIFGRSGREGSDPSNSRGMADKMIYGQKVAQGVGPDCRCISGDNAFELYNKEQQRKAEFAKKEIPYTPGVFWPLKNAVVVGYNHDFLKQIQVGKIEDDGRKFANLHGVQVSHVMNDRLAHYLLNPEDGLNEQSFKYCNITVPEGNDKDQTFARQDEYSAKMHAAIAGFDAGGLEKPVLHGTIERDPKKDLAGLADDFYKACKAASDQEIRNGKSGDLVTKSTGTNTGVGVTLIKKEDIPFAREIFTQHIIPEVKPYTGDALGFPFALQSFFTPNVVNGKVPEVRIVPHVVEFEGTQYMVACPAIIKTGPVPEENATHYEVVKANGEKHKVEHLKKSNVGTADKTLPQEVKEGRDYLSTIVEAGCNLTNLERYGVSKDQVIKASKYVAGLAVHAIEVNMRKTGLSPQVPRAKAE